MHPDALPVERPDGLDLVTVERSWVRFDRHAPSTWDWQPFARPRHRFDSVSGSHRVRYAGSDLIGAARERFEDTDRIISASDHDHWVVILTGRLRVIDLCLDDTLDALTLDDRVNTGRLSLGRVDGDDMLDTCGTLTDRLAQWFGPELHGISYRSRTTPQHATNLAFFAHAPLEVTDVRQVRQVEIDVLAELVLRHGFHVEGLLDG